MKFSEFVQIQLPKNFHRKTYTTVNMSAVVFPPIKAETGKCTAINI